jgi:hypothetical protein
VPDASGTEPTSLLLSTKVPAAFRRFYRTRQFAVKTRRPHPPPPKDATSLHHFQLEAALQIHPGGLGDG